MDLDWNVEFYFLSKLLLFINHKKVLNNYYLPKQLLIYIIEVIESFDFREYTSVEHYSNYTRLFKYC